MGSLTVISGATLLRNQCHVCSNAAQLLLRCVLLT